MGDFPNQMLSHLLCWPDLKRGATPAPGRKRRRPPPVPAPPAPQPSFQPPRRPPPLLPLPPRPCPRHAPDPSAPCIPPPIYISEMIRSHEPEIDAGCESSLKRTRRTTRGFFKRDSKASVFHWVRVTRKKGKLCGRNSYEPKHLWFRCRGFFKHYNSLGTAQGNFKTSCKPKSLWTSEKKERRYICANHDIIGMGKKTGGEMVKASRKGQWQAQRSSSYKIYWPMLTPQ